MSSETSEEVVGGVFVARQPEEVDIAEISKIEGRFVVIWRKESKQLAQVEKVFEKDFIYKMVTGPDKGQRYKALFFCKTIRVYDEENLVLAIAE